MSKTYEEGAYAERVRGSVRVECSLQVPYLYAPVVGTRDDASPIEPETAHQLLVPLQHAQTRSAVHVPDSTMHTDTRSLFTTLTFNLYGFLHSTCYILLL